MSMDIGGVDLRLTKVPRAAYDPRLILAEIAEAWPESVFEGLEDDFTTPVREILDGNVALSGDEFFVFRNQASARNWQRKGATSKNGNDMLHFIATRSRRGNSVDITMVIGDFTPEMGRLYWAVDNALTKPKGRLSIP
jgi:hypothetical protein